MQIQKPIKKIKSGTFDFLGRFGVYDPSGWELVGYSITVIQDEEFFTKLVFSNGETLVGKWPVEKSRMNIKKDLESRRNGFHFGDFPSPFCRRISQVPTEGLEKGSDLWVFKDPQMECSPEIRKAILAFPGERTSEEVYGLYNAVRHGWIELPSSWEEYDSLLKKERQKRERSMRSAPSNKDEM